jgi:hypothetical protein
MHKQLKRAEEAAAHVPERKKRTEPALQLHRLFPGTCGKEKDRLPTHGVQIANSWLTFELVTN